jgi:hypothetical protein
MATWECRGCTAAYAPDAPRCPQCGVNDPIKEAEQLQRENEMAKVSVHHGASNAFTGEGMPEPVNAEADEHRVGGEVETTDVEDQEGDGDARAFYEAQTVEDLKAELRSRPGDLSTSGNKSELVDRLLEDDARQAEQHTAE